MSMAERVGFEPTEPVKAHSISNAANSATLAPFLSKLNCQIVCLYHLSTSMDSLFDNDDSGSSVFTWRFAYDLLGRRYLIVADHPAINHTSEQGS